MVCLYFAVLPVTTSNFISAKDGLLANLTSPALAIGFLLVWIPSPVESTFIGDALHFEVP